ncbi:hypothetical protein HN51_047579, partial [Arachis hypogaea]
TKFTRGITTDEKWGQYDSFVCRVYSMRIHTWMLEHSKTNGKISGCPRTSNARTTTRPSSASIFLEIPTTTASLANDVRFDG